MTDKQKQETRFSVTIDVDLWHQVGMHVAKLSKPPVKITRREFLEQALREKLARDKEGK